MHCKAGCRYVIAKLCDQFVIPSAGQYLVPIAGQIALDDDAGVVVRPVDHTQVNGHLAVLAQPDCILIHAAEIVQNSLHLLTLEVPGSLFKNLLAAKQTGQHLHCPDCFAVPDGIQQVIEGRIVLEFNQTADLLLGFLVRVQLIHQFLEYGNIPKLQGEGVVGTSLQHLQSGGDHFQIRQLGIRTDQLNAGLGNLVTASLQLGRVGVYTLVVVQPQRQGRILQPGCNHPGDRHGGIRADHQQPPFAVRKFIHLLLGEVCGLVTEYIKKLQNRCDDLRKSPASENLFDPVLHAAALCAFGKQIILGALRGNQIVVSHGCLRLLPHSFHHFTMLTC